ncbi:MAG TPA: DUF2332 domain-containing protein, partial [Candidatus Nanopelagicales bacterium]
EAVALTEALGTQAENCALLGSPLSHDVLVALLALTEPGGALAEPLADLHTVRGGDLVGLRLLAAAHRMVLARMAPELAVHYPTAGGTAPSDEAGRAALRDAVRSAFLRHPEVVRDSLARIPQTNETGRALPLRGALGRVAAAHGQPMRLHELAASAGLNLRADAMPWAHAPMTAAVTITERAGCDLHPLDVDRPEDRLTLASYVWGDDLARFERLRSSFVLAHRIPATVRAMAAGAYVHHLAHTEPVPGQTLVVWHSATWFYLDRAARAEIRSGMRRLAGRATPQSPVVHVSWEWLRDSPDPSKSFALVGRSWPAAGAWAPWRAGTSVLLGTGPAHGMPMRWCEPRPLPTDPLE